MAITLYYIEGITRADEPVFDSIDNQVKFFSNHMVSSIDSGFYPPHYQNEIRLQINDEIDLTKSINYLSLEFGNKVYYYFIDDIEYISEDVISLLVTMDVIQTYMFDIDFINSAIERNTINRKTADGKINRDYIREQVSNGMYVNYEYQLIHNNIDWIILKFSDDVNIPSRVVHDGTQTYTKGGYFIAKYYGHIVGHTGNSPTDYELQICDPYAYIYEQTQYPYIDTTSIFGIKSMSIANKIYSDGCTYFFIPITRDRKNIRINYGTSGYFDVIDMKKVFLYLRNIAQYPELVEMRYCPYDILSSIYTFNYDNVTEEYNITMPNDVPVLYPYRTDVTWFVSLNYVPVFLGNINDFKTIADTNWPKDGSTSNFQPGQCEISASTISISDKTISYAYMPKIFNNTSVTSFTYRNIPQLMDENYIHIYFGERSGYTSFPLHLLDGKQTLNMHFIYDCLTGVRVYYVNDDASTADKYLTLIQDSTAEIMPLYNDAWNNYLSNNYATWTRGYKLAEQQACYQAIGDLAENLSDNFTTYKRLGKMLVNRKRKKLPALTQKRSEAFEAVGKTVADLAEQTYVISTERSILHDNLTYTPDTLKQGNNCTADIISDTTTWFYGIYIVSDIDDCAREFESKGFKVHISLSNQNLFNYQKRYYYDVIKCSDLNITLKVLNDETTIQEIKDRFKNGLRLWHTDNGVLRQSLGNMFQYDNADVYSTEGE